jgi:hypothetical protein
MDHHTYATSKILKVSVYGMTANACFVLLWNISLDIDAVLLFHENVANGLIYSPQLWRTQKYCWTKLV